MRVVWEGRGAVAQLVGCFPSHVMPWVRAPAQHKLGVKLLTWCEVAPVPRTPVLERWGQEPRKFKVICYH